MEVRRTTRLEFQLPHSRRTDELASYPLPEDVQIPLPSPGIGRPRRGVRECDKQATRQGL